ncbi:GNAT family N-acetyltransferase [Paracoccus sp. MC1854]|uniref:GNAT family N-acetyltransferase n=1 Tax=Paracoccus sp. MC1854 TaxID=2760306 RepID=UPI00351C8057
MNKQGSDPRPVPVALQAMTGVTIAMESPLSSDLDLLFARHVQAMHADTPPESIHMLPRQDLVSPLIDFLVLRAEGAPVGMGALKRIAPDHGEIKSMHILSEQRGEGHARRLLQALIDQAKARDYRRVSLETGTQDSFGPARVLYARAGFTECAPFAGYAPDPNSVFMTSEV